MRLRPSNGNVIEDQEPFMGIKARRKASFHRDYKGDYVDVVSQPFLMKILQKQGLSSDTNISSPTCISVVFRNRLKVVHC